jgi:cellulose synthase operon protein YhjU
MTPWLWTFYLAVKLVLQFRGAARVHFLWNAAFAALALPLPPRKAPLVPTRGWRAAAVLAAAAALLWYDSYLPPFRTALAFVWRDPAVLTSGFLRGFLPGLLASPGLLAGLTGLLALCLLIGRSGLPAAPFALAVLLSAPLTSLGEPSGPVADAAREFFRSEKGRLVRLPRAAGAPFDVILIQVCSLSWDDLEAAGRPEPRLLDGAAYVFTRFNSAASYSTDAGLRLLRAPCGQAAQEELYKTWPPECALLGQLRAAGLRTYAAMNTEPGYFEMEADLRRLAGVDEPVPVAGLKAALKNFDGHPVYASGDVLERWWKERARSGEPRAALFYNTLALHAGVHVDAPRWWLEPPLRQYTRTLDELGGDVDRLAGEIAASGRSAVIVIVGEHGRALRGSALQAPELRDIPLPPITRVPAAVRLVGPAFAGAPRGRRSDKPVSYLALAQLLADLLADPGAARDAARLDADVAALPETVFMSESPSWKVFSYQGADQLLGKDGTWRALPASP